MSSSVTTSRTVIFGCSKSGKSFGLWQIVLREYKRGNAVWLVDPQREHWRTWRAALESPARGGPPLLRRGSHYITPKLGLKRPPRGRNFDLVEQVAARACVAGYPLTLVVDELGTAVKAGGTVSAGPPSAHEILHEGRHLPRGKATGVGMIGVARRPVELPEDWVSQAEEKLVFRLTTRSGKQWALEEGMEADDVKRLHLLRRGEFFHFVDGEPWHNHVNIFSDCPPLIDSTVVTHAA